MEFILLIIILMLVYILYTMESCITNQNENFTDDNYYNELKKQNYDRYKLLIFGM